MPATATDVAFNTKGLASATAVSFASAVRMVDARQMVAHTTEPGVRVVFEFFDHYGLAKFDLPKHAGPVRAFRDVVEVAVFPVGVRQCDKRRFQMVFQIFAAIAHYAATITTATVDGANRVGVRVVVFAHGMPALAKPGIQGKGVAIIPVLRAFAVFARAFE
jgi:hypothetical protein